MNKKLVFSLRVRVFSLFCALTLLWQLFFPTAVLAITSGPSQPEFQSFAQADQTEMVDLYSGDFNYNIPLLSVPGPNGGYPINLSYNSNVSMEEEASWVGLGWALNVGAINRELRGLPDDFNGESMKYYYKMKENVTTGLKINGLKMSNEYLENFGFPPFFSEPPKFTTTIYYNNIRGLGYSVNYTFPSIKTPFASSLIPSIGFDSQSGVDMSLNVSGLISIKKYNASLTAGVNSRQGKMNISFNQSVNNRRKGNAHPMGMSSSTSFEVNQFPSEINIPTYTRVENFDIKVNGQSGSPKFGVFQANYIGQVWEGYSSTTEAFEEEIEKPAYGYLYGQNASEADDVIDFNRGSFNYSKAINYLPSSNVTYDIFHQVGQGSGGAFRAYQYGVPVYHNAKSVSKVETGNFSPELGFEYDFTLVPLSIETRTHAGYNPSIGTGESYSGNWKDVEFLNTAHPCYNANQFSFQEKGSDEYNYFQFFGEKSAVDPSEFSLDDWRGEAAYRLKLNKNTSNIINRYWEVNNSDLVTATTGGSSIPQGDLVYLKNKTNGPTGTATRKKRSNLINTVTYGQAGKSGVFSSNNVVTTGSVSGLSSYKDNQIKEISVLQSDGMRYVYGLPAYNTKSKEMMFSVSPLAGSDVYRGYSDVTASSTNASLPSIPSDNNVTDGIIQGSENSNAYAHAWLITAVYSADYVDVTNNGPTSDDLGYWVRFNYTRANKDFKWRSPYVKASYMPGYDDGGKDDKASYSYGEKEIYYVKSIETKTHVAVFELIDRHDALSAIDEFANNTNSISSAQKLKALSKIKLYTRSDYEENGTSAVPVETVHFKYSYKLCPNMVNNDGVAVDIDGNSVSTGSPLNVNSTKGKLTLEKVFYTYFNNTRSALNPYEFTYASFNPGYDINNIDRWGNFKDNSTNVYPNNRYNFRQFPYVDQAASATNNTNYASVWKLSEITLPSKSKIKISYELDDYAYVEGKKATRMFDIKWIGNLSGANFILDRDNNTQIEQDVEENNNPPVWFEMEEPMPANVASSDYDKYIFDHYISGLNQIYFKVQARVKGKDNGSDNKYWDYLSGYGEPVQNRSGCGAVLNHGKWYGYFTFLEVNLNKKGNGKNVHPFTLAAIQHLKHNRPDVLYTPSVLNGNSPKSNFINFATSILGGVIAGGGGHSFYDDLGAMILGYNQWAYNYFFNKNEIRLNGNSIVKLQDPNQKKYGGGSRVKSVIIEDIWVNNEATGASELNRYGSVYDYTIKENDVAISSGVAYEPHVGKEESALTGAVKYVNSNFIGGSQTLFTETPIMESYYPASNVGYRKVTVKSISSQFGATSNENPLKVKQALGNAIAPYSEYEFFTGKDYPVFFDETDIQNDKAIKMLKIVPIVYAKGTVRKALSQGYSITLNDMAGKPKRVAKYTSNPYAGQDKGRLISETIYNYSTVGKYKDDGENRLNNTVKVLDVDNSGNIMLKSALIGVDFDTYVDAHEDFNKHTSYGAQLNVENQLNVTAIAPPVALFSVEPIPSMSATEQDLKYIVLNKIIRKSGILESVESRSYNSTIITKNVAYDKATGEALLTQVNNEFNQPVYNLQFPGSFYYMGLKPSYNNNGRDAGFTSAQIVAGERLKITLTATDVAYFNKGDLVSVYAPSTSFAGGSNFVKTHVTNIIGNDIYVFWGGKPSVVSSTGNKVIIVQSGQKNMLNAMVGNVTALNLGSLSVGSALDFTNTGLGKNIINASALEFITTHKTFCSKCEFESGEAQSYSIDMASPWDPYAYGKLGIWRPSKVYGYTGERYYTSAAKNPSTDGVYDMFTPFNWLNPTTNSSRWKLASTVTGYSPYGFEIETMDPLGNKSTAHYGYNQSMVTHIAKNSNYKETGFESFEDYVWLFRKKCNDHFGFSGYQQYISSDRAHSGKKSIKLQPNTTLEFKGKTKTGCN